MKEKFTAEQIAWRELWVRQARERLLAAIVTNDYGDYVSCSLPTDYTCRANGVRVQFLMGWTDYGPDKVVRYLWTPEMQAAREALSHVKKLPTDEERREKNRKARDRRDREISDLASDLGVLRDSRTLAAYRRGEIDYDEAQRIGEITRHRHEDTDYDELLAAGYSKDEARACMTEY